MKNHPALPEPNEADIRSYAYHLYEQSNRLSGRDLDNWLEATACLKANIPRHWSRIRIHHHAKGFESGGFAAEPKHPTS